MIKFVATLNGRKVLGLGLSFRNLDEFRAEPLETFIEIKGDEIGLDFDVIIFSGETEASMTSIVKIGPDTVAHINPKLKS